jgi:hypothetical protein
MRETAKAIFRVVGLPIVGIVVSHAFLEFVHAKGWYPEVQLASLMTVSTDAWHVGWTRALIMAAMTVALWLLGYWVFFGSTKPPKRIRAVKPSPASTAEPSKAAAQSLLRLSVGEDHSFYDFPKTTLYSQTRCYKVRLDNISPDQSVSECKVNLIGIEPTSGYRLPRLLKAGFSLAAGDHAFIPIASYGEAREPAKYNCADTLVVVAGDGRDLAIQFELPNCFIIRATAIGSPFTELKCYTWVDQDGRFRISDSPPTAQTVGGHS